LRHASSQSTKNTKRSAEGLSRTLAAVPQGAESAFIGLVIAQVSYRSSDIHLPRDGPHCVSLGTICHAYFDTTVEFLQHHSGAMGDRPPPQQYELAYVGLFASRPPLALRWRIVAPF
jgi:hypothetical protein